MRQEESGPDVDIVTENTTAIPITMSSFIVKMYTNAGAVNEFLPRKEKL